MKSRIALAAALVVFACAAQAQPAPSYSVAEPKSPPKAKAAVRKRAAKANAKVQAPEAKTQAEPRVVAANEPPFKPSGPCVIKPVMSDQDLINCGARPQH